jgi:hypothetical protein
VEKSAEPSPEEKSSAREPGSGSSASVQSAPLTGEELFLVRDFGGAKQLYHYCRQCFNRRLNFPNDDHVQVCIMCNFPTSLVDAGELAKLTPADFQTRVSEFGIRSVIDSALYSAICTVTPYKESAADLVHQWREIIAEDKAGDLSLHKLLSDVDYLRRRVGRSMHYFATTQSSWFSMSKDNFTEQELESKVRAFDDWADDVQSEQMVQWLTHPDHLRLRDVKHTHSRRSIAVLGPTTRCPTS